MLRDSRLPLGAAASARLWDAERKPAQGVVAIRDRRVVAAMPVPSSLSQGAARERAGPMVGRTARRPRAHRGIAAQAGRRQARGGLAGSRVAWQRAPMRAAGRTGRGTGTRTFPEERPPVMAGAIGQPPAPVRAHGSSRQGRSIIQASRGASSPHRRLAAGASHHRQGRSPPQGCFFRDIGAVLPHPTRRGRAGGGAGCGRTRPRARERAARPG